MLTCPSIQRFSPCTLTAATPAKLARGTSAQGGIVTSCKSTLVPHASAATAEGGFWAENSAPTVSDLWNLGIADCESATCEFVPDGAIILVPFAEVPQKREERLKQLAEGVRLQEDEATIVGAVSSTKVNFLLDSPVVSAKHARIEGVFDETEPSWIQSMLKQKDPVKYYLTDLSSTNGTYLNRGKLRPLTPVQISPGDIIAFGSLKNAYRVVQATPRKGWTW